MVFSYLVYCFIETISEFTFLCITELETLRCYDQHSSLHSAVKLSIVVNKIGNDNLLNYDK